MTTPTREQKLIFDLLQEYSTLDKVRQFLAERKLPRTAAAWKEMVEGRLAPALEKGQITQEDLINELRESEEHGDQHIFLYETQTQEEAKRLIDRNRIKRILRGRGLESIVNRPQMVAKPTSPTIVDARWEETGPDTWFVLKIVETWIYERITGEERREGNQRIREIEEIPTRAAHLFRLRSNGLLELRIQSYTNESEYNDAVRRMWDLVGDLLPEDKFDLVSLQRAKTNMWRKRDQQNDEIRHSGSFLKNDSGTTLRIASGSEKANLSDDKTAAKSLDAFMGPDTRCDRYNVWFIRREGIAIPSKDIHVILGGNINEFAVPAKSSKEDYGYVLGRILHHNR